MNIFEHWGQQLFSRIDGLPVGFVGGLSDIYGDGWDQTGNSGERKEFGKQFKEAVESKNIPCLKWVGIAPSGRHDLYEKVEEL